MVLNELGASLTCALRKLTSDGNKIDKNHIDEIVKEICGALLRNDVNILQVKQLKESLAKNIVLDSIPPGANKRKIVQGAILNSLIQLVDPGVPCWSPSKSTVNVVMLVGLQGAGKTTTCTKLAHYYKTRGYRVGLVCTDTFRAGAFDQLKQNATRAGIPYYGSYSESDPVQLAIDGTKKFTDDGFNFIIVDTSGRHKQEASLFLEMTQISTSLNPSCHILVMDGTIGQMAHAQASAFKSSIPIGSIIITKLDGHAKGGGALSAVAATCSPIMFLGTGEGIHDLDTFNAKQFVGKLLGLGDVQGFLEIAKDMKLDQLSSTKNLEQGIFTLRDMREQFQMISKMGPISKVMQMMPGIPPEMAKMVDENGGGDKLKKMVVIIDSMNQKELDSDPKLFTNEPSRIYRVARGSGATVVEIQQLLQQYKMFKDMMKNMPKGMLSGKQQRGQPNPNQIAKMQQGIQKMLPPGMLEQMGGMSGLMDMARKMSGGEGGGGIPDMQKMMEMMSRK